MSFEPKNIEVLLQVFDECTRKFGDDERTLERFEKEFHWRWKTIMRDWLQEQPQDSLWGPTYRMLFHKEKKGKHVIYTLRLGDRIHRRDDDEWMELLEKKDGQTQTVVWYVANGHYLLDLAVHVVS